MTSWGRAARMSLQAISRGVETTKAGSSGSRDLGAQMLRQQQSRGMAGKTQAAAGSWLDNAW